MGGRGWFGVGVLIIGCSCGPAILDAEEKMQAEPSTRSPPTHTHKPHNTPPHTTCVDQAAKEVESRKLEASLQGQVQQALEANRALEAAQATCREREAAVCYIYIYIERERNGQID
jgi:hypothetical protein